MRRIYNSILDEHVQQDRQMFFLSGPRQVGKTTTAKTAATDENYFTWDNQNDRMVITGGPKAVARRLQLSVLSEKPMVVVFDELHKYSKWKDFLKGFFDTYGEGCRVIVTGSSRLTVFNRGGDSLMGRYFVYRMHPLSVGELRNTELQEMEIQQPFPVQPDVINSLLTFGGFPEPFTKANTRFYNRWRRLRTEQLFNEDLRDLTRIQDIGQIQVLAELIQHQAGQPVNYSTLAVNTNISVDTARRWIRVLENIYYCFSVRPWFRNVPKTLRKQPKLYLWDWSMVGDKGARYENFIASHLLKAVNWWTDIGLGTYGLYYLRDKEKREADFLITKNDDPWFILEVKSKQQTQISSALPYFQSITKADHAFQVMMEAEYIERDCFEITTPVQVPAATFLSQLI